MHSENPFELSTNAFEGGTGPLVAHIRVKADPAHLPPLGGMRQHEQFGLGVDRRPDCRTRQPGVADFAGIGGAAAVRRVALAATAIFPGSKPRRADYRAIIYADRRERHGAPGTSLSESGVGVFCGFHLALRYRTPRIK